MPARRSHRSGRSHHSSGRRAREVSLDAASTEAFFDQLERDEPIFTGPAPQGEGEQARHGRRRRRRRPWVKRHKALTVLLVLLAALGGSALGLVWWLLHAVGGIERIDDPFTGLMSRPAYSEDGAVTFLVLGSDSRTSAGDPAQWEAGAQRTDTIMVVQVSGDRRDVNVMSIPRDSWVTVPANDVVDHDSQAKINAAYSWGGPTLLIQTVENLTGIRIDHFAVADFESFRTLTDELGGVEITLTQPLDLSGHQDAGSSADVLQPGTHTLTGDQALVYARERYTLPNGDLDRIKRQQNWMRAILRAAVSRNTLTDPVRLTGFVNAVSGSVAVDEGLTNSDMFTLARSMRSVHSDDVNFFQAPVAGTGTSEDGQSIVNLDTDRLAEVCEAFRTDTVTEYVAEHADELNRLGTQVS